MGDFAGIIHHEPTRSARLLEDLMAPLLHGKEAGPSLDHESLQVGTAGDVVVAENVKETLWIALDGHIANMETLRERLRIKGFPCVTPEISELLLQAFNAWGPAMAEHLEGEYAIVVFDKKKHRCFLIRDRIGRKPLYWCEAGQHVLFSTKVKGLLATGLLPQTCARDGLAAYLFFTCCPQDLTPIQGVNKLLPGYILDYNLDKSRSIKGYWSYSSFFTQEHRVKPENLPQQVCDGLFQHAKRWLEGERAVGCILDGRLPSTALAAQTGAKARGRKILYTSSALSDLEEIQPTVNRLKSDFGFEHCHLPGDLRSMILDLPKLVWHLDEPIAAFSYLPLWEILETAKEDHCTLLMPTGGTETLGGDPRYLPRMVQQSVAHLLSALPRPILRKTILPIVRLFSRGYAYEILRRTKYNPLQGSYVRHLALFSEKEFRFLSPTLANCLDADVFLHKFHHLNAISDVASALMYFDVKTYLPDKWLFIQDRLMQALGLSWEAPYIHQETVELLAQVEPEKKFDKKQSPVLMKQVIELLMPGLNPAPINPRPRLIAQIREELDQLPSVLDTLLDSWLLDAGIISKKGIKQLLFEANNSDHGLEKAWAVLVLEVWFRLFIGRPVQSSPPEMDLLTILREKR